MNMNKKILCILIAFLSLFIFNKNVFAADCSKYACATCVYKDSRFKFAYTLESSGDGSADLRFSTEVLMPANGMTQKLNSKKIVARNFINADNQLFCPQKLYIVYTAGGTTISGDVYDIKMDKSIEVSLLTSESKNNNLLVSADGQNIQNPCSYTCSDPQGRSSAKVTISVVNNDLKYELSDGYQIFESNNPPTVNDFSNGTCPKLTCTCGNSGDNKGCRVNLPSEWDESRGNVQEGVEELEAGMEPPTKPHSTTTLRHNYVGEGLCGEEDVQKILKMAGYILIIVKIMVPLILIVMGTMDLYKAVVGKDEKDLTKSIKSLALRIALGIFIFFIPSLVNVIIDSMDDPVGDRENNKSCLTCVLDPGSC